MKQKQKNRSKAYFTLVKEVVSKARKLAEMECCPLGIVSKHEYRKLDEFSDTLSAGMRKIWDAQVNRIWAEYHAPVHNGYSAAEMDRWHLNH